MDAMQFIKTYGIPEATRVAQEAGTTYNYFYQIAAGHRNAGWGLAQKIVVASKNQIDLFSLLQSTPDRKTG